MLINFHYSYILSGFANAGMLTIFPSVRTGEETTLSLVRWPERERWMFCWLWGESPGVKRHWKSSGALTICRSSQHSETRRIQFSPWVTLSNLSLGLFFPPSACLSVSFSVSVSYPDTHTHLLMSLNNNISMIKRDRGSVRLKTGIATHTTMERPVGTKAWREGCRERSN